MKKTEVNLFVDAICILLGFVSMIVGAKNLAKISDLVSGYESDVASNMKITLNVGIYDILLIGGLLIMVVFFGKFCEDNKCVKSQSAEKRNNIPNENQQMQYAQVPQQVQYVQPSQQYVPTYQPAQNQPIQQKFVQPMQQYVQTVAQPTQTYVQPTTQPIVKTNSTATSKSVANKPTREEEVESKEMLDVVKKIQNYKK